MLEFQDKKKCKKKITGCCRLIWYPIFFFQLDRTALHWASANGNIDVIEKLVEDGADLESKDKVHFNVGNIVESSELFVTLQIFFCHWKWTDSNSSMF